MGIPGSNLLKIAFSIIARQTLLYYKYISRSKNSVYVNKPTFDLAIEVRGSFQPVPKNRYEQMGLDFSKSYFVLYVPFDFLDLQRNVAGDRVEFEGKLYQCESNTDWFKIDGWKGILCVEILPDSA